MMQTFNYTDNWGDKLTIAFVKEQYAIDNSIAMQAIYTEPDIAPEWDSYANITINLPKHYKHSNKHALWLDSNNNKHLIKWMVQNNLLQLTGKVAHRWRANYYEAIPTEKLLNACTSIDDIAY